MTHTTSAGRRLIRSGPGALARLIGNPGAAAAVRQHAAEHERAVGAPAGPAERTPADWPRDEIVFEVLDEGDELLVLADMPGIDDLQVYAYPNQLVVHLRAERQRSTHPLPVGVDPTSLRATFRNGILAVWLTKRRP
jgi:HSP20 family molecular chaperone IbpA